MNYLINTVTIPFKPNEVLEFESDTLCKIISADTFLDIYAEPMLNIKVLNRWGTERTPKKKHSIIAIEEGKIIEITKNYEPVLTRRGSFYYHGTKFYLFGIE